MIDTDAIRRIPISQIIGRYITLVKNGKHHDAICPFHPDTKTGNFKVTDSKSIYNCFVCHAHGDSIEFVMNYKRITFEQACEEITGMKLKEVVLPPEKKVIQINPVPDSAGLPKNLGNKHWIYRNPDGSVYGVVKRVDGKDGKKEIYPMIYTTDGWQTKGFQGKIPLFGIHNKNIQSTALLVEGEKTAEYLQSILPDKLVVTWQGGTNATLSKIDWSELNGMDIVIFPDNDNTGFKAMHKIRQLLGSNVGSVKWVNPPVNSPPAWDVADSNFDKPQMVEYIKNHITDYTGMEAYTPFVAVTEPDSIDNLYNDDEKPFIPLGFTVSDDGSQRFVIYVKSSKVILHTTAQSITGNNLLTLAPANYWQLNFPGNKGGIDSFTAANFIVQACAMLGKFDSEVLRGRGAWKDNGRIIFHAGNKLFINGVESPLGKPPNSEYVYEAGVNLDINLDNPLTASEARRIFEVTDLVNWANKNESMLFAGWHFIAPICGALTWRPHLVVTGMSGSGKSYMASQSKKLLGKMLVVTAGSTSEPAIRQLLGMDALPLIFEEIDTTTKQGDTRVKQVVELMRNSSQDGQATYKGSTSGEAKKYMVRSCFGLIGVGVVQTQETDINRVTILNLVKYIESDSKTDENPHFLRLEQKVGEIFTDEWVDRFIARSIKMVHVTLKNIEIFTHAAMPYFKGRKRENDQLSAILGGWWTIFNDRHVTMKEAAEIITSNGFHGSANAVNTIVQSHERLLELLLMSKLRYENDGKTLERTVLELIIETEPYTDKNRKCPAHDTLNRNGFRLMDDEFLISNSHQNIKKLLEGTEWGNNHNKFLLRIDGARATETIYFKGQVKSSAAVALPLRTIIHTSGDAYIPDSNTINYDEQLDSGELPF